MVFSYIKGCWSWLTSWSWFTATPTPPLPSSDSAARASLLKLLEGKFVMPGKSLEEGVHALFDNNQPTDFRNLFLKMWQAKPKMYVEMIRCLESDLCNYFGVDPSFKRLCFRIGHYLDDHVYSLFSFPEDDAEFIRSKQLAKAAWVIIGLWVLDGTDGLKRFVKVLKDNEYGGAIECIRRERCRELFGVSRIPEYTVTDEGFILTQSLPDMPRRRTVALPPRLIETLPMTTDSNPMENKNTENTSSELSSSLPILHSSLLSGLPIQN